MSYSSSSSIRRVATGVGIRVALCAAVIGTVYVLASYGNSYEQQVIVLACIYVILVSSLNLLVGLTGLVSIGHQAFFGLGAYVSALFTIKTGLPSYLGVVVASLAALPVAFLVGKVTLRLRAAFFVIATLAVAEIFRIVVMNQVSFTGGPNGLPGVPPLEIPGGRQFASSYEAMIPVSILAGIVVLACWVVSTSTFGARLRAIRENEELAKAMGINTPNLASLVFMMSASMASMAGALYAHFIGFISPDVFSFGLMVTLLLMLIIGGMGTVIGPVVGAVVLTLLPEVLRFSEQWRLVIYGAALMALARLLPKGLWGGAVSLAHAVRRRAGARSSLRGPLESLGGPAGGATQHHEGIHS